MDMRTHGNTPLHSLDSQVPPAVLAEELAARLQEGRGDEVAAFLSSTAVGWSYELGQLQGAPWRRDHDTWLAFARLTVPQGRLLRGDWNKDIPRRSAELTAELQALARARLASVQRESGNLWVCLNFILARLLVWMGYPGMPRDEALALLRWALELLALADIDPRGRIHPQWTELLEALDDADLLQLAEEGSELCRGITSVWASRHKALPHPERFAPWYDFVRRHPDYYDWHDTHDDIHKDPGLIALRWELGANAEQRANLAELLFSQASRSPAEHFNAVFDRLVREAPQLFVELLENWRVKHFDVVLAEQIWRAQYPELLPHLLPSILQQSELQPFVGVLNDMLAANPACWRDISTPKLATLLPLLDPALIRANLALLGELLAASSSKALREAATQAMRDFSPAEIAASGWLEIAGKNMQLACRDILLGHPDPAVVPLLRQLLDGGALDLGSASRVEVRLQELGVEMPDAAMPDLAALEARVARFKRFGGAIKAYDAEEVLALCAPLSAHAARILLYLAATTEDELPPLAERLLAEISAENRARLSQALVQIWVALKGDPKQRWALKLVAGNIDDRVVDTLAAAVRAWGWSMKLRAVIAVEQLGTLDTLYALSQLKVLSASRKLKDMVVEAVFDILRAAARRRGLSLPELFDELTPDFGLGEGLVLNVGPHAYRVELQGDLSLRVINDKGKASKSLPALKDESLRAEWDAASACLKTTASGLKTVVKQQVPRLQTALLTGQRWSLARWQRLFLQHPLLRIVGRSLIWRLVESGRSFRIAEDFSLVDVVDEAVVLPAEGQVSLWHPLDADVDEIAAWRSYLDDYELKPLVEQLDAPAVLPALEQWQGSELRPPCPLTITQGALSGLLSKWNYRPGQASDGPRIYEHSLDLPAAQLYVELHHDSFMAYMDLDNRVAIEHVVVYDTSRRGDDGRWRKLSPQEWPRSLQAAVQDQFNALAAKAVPNKESD